MSKGPGRVQRAILALIEAEPDGAWTVDDLCRLIYGSPKPRRSQLVAVRYALNHLMLPGTWETRTCWGCKLVLCDPCNMASLRKANPHCREHVFQPGGWGFETHERAKRWRDGSPLERIEMRIAETQKATAMLAAAGALTRETVVAFAERIKALETARAKLDNGSHG